MTDKNLTLKIMKSNQVTLKSHVDYPNLKLVKYKREVFFKGLWNEVTKVSRGCVIDTNTHKFVVRPFDKVFNVGENKTNIKKDRLVRAVRKMNGFMGCVTHSSLLSDILYTTTGSFDSEFVDMIKDKIGEHEMFNSYINSPDCKHKDKTFIFEICHENDPHIITETHGVYLIGVRDVNTGEYFKESELDDFARHFGLMRPEHFLDTFENVVKLCNSCTHEGFMIKDDTTEEYIAKLKSPYYLSKKFFMRANTKTIFNTENYKERVDEEYYHVIEKIRRDYNVDTWEVLTVDDKLSYLTDVFNDGKYMMNESVKVCTIVRGIPGSGKTTYANTMAKSLAYSPSDVVCSADDFMLDENGEYNYHPSKLNYAHTMCFEKFKSLVDNGVEHVFVANTSTRKSEYERYQQYAESKGYMVFVIEMSQSFQNVHGVPDEHLERMKTRFER